MGSLVYGSLLIALWSVLPDGSFRFLDFETNTAKSVILLNVVHDGLQCSGEILAHSGRIHINKKPDLLLREDTSGILMKYPWHLSAEYVLTRLFL